MPTKRYTYGFYDDPIRMKSILILIAFAVLGVATGLSEGELSVTYPVAGFTVGILCIAVSYNMQTSYTLHEEKITVAINFMGIPILSESAEYSDITGIDWEPNPPYRLGYNPIGDFESHHYNLGGGHIRIKQDNSKDITFSATKEELEMLQDTLTS